MSYLQTSYSRILYLLCILIMLANSSCSTDETVIPAAANSFKGEIAGTSFESTILGALESNGFYSITGNINTDANFQLYTNGNNLLDHPIAVEGPLVEALNIINELADSIIAQATSPNFDVDSALNDLTDYFTEKIDSVLSDSTQEILQENQSYLLYLIDEVIYYSTSGSIIFTKIDEELNRLDGNFDIELRNFSNGYKRLVGTFEDIQFIRQE